MNIIELPDPECEMEEEGGNGQRRTDYRDWTTADEISFVNSLGMHGYGGAEPYAAMLRRYIKASSLRANWDKIDGEKVVKHARARLGMVIAAGEDHLPRCRVSLPKAYNVGVA